MSHVEVTREPAGRERAALDLLEGEQGSADTPPAAPAPLSRLREAVRDGLQRRPYLILAAACGLGLAVGARRRALREVAGVALRSGFASVLDALLQG